MEGNSCGSTSSGSNTLGSANTHQHLPRSNCDTRQYGDALTGGQWQAGENFERKYSTHFNL